MGRFLRERPLAVAGLVALLLVLAAAVAPSRFALSPELPDTHVPLPDTPALLDYALFVLAGLTAMAILTWIAWTTGNPLSQKQRQQRMWGQLFIIGLIATVIALVAKTRSTLLGEGEIGPGDAGNPRQIGQPIGEGPNDINPWVLAALSIAIVLLVIAAAIYILRKKVELARESSADYIYDEMGRGIDDLQQISQPRNAVIGCYVRMEKALERSGIRKRRSDTPLELLERVLAERKVKGEAPAELTSLFEIAKFSTMPVDETMRKRALAALVEIRMQLAPPEEAPA